MIWELEILGWGGHIVKTTTGSYMTGWWIVLRSPEKNRSQQHTYVHEKSISSVMLKHLSPKSRRFWIRHNRRILRCERKYFVSRGLGMWWSFCHFIWKLFMCLAGCWAKVFVVMDESAFSLWILLSLYTNTPSCQEAKPDFFTICSLLN